MGNRLAQPVGCDAHPLARHLHEGFVRRPVIAQHDGEAGKTLTADQTDFEPFMAVFSDDRSQPIADEIAVGDGFIGHFQNLSKRKDDRLKIGLQQSFVGGRQARKNAIFVGN